MSFTKWNKWIIWNTRRNKEKTRDEKTINVPTFTKKENSMGNATSRKRFRRTQNNNSKCKCINKSRIWMWHICRRRWCINIRNGKTKNKWMVWTMYSRSICRIQIWKRLWFIICYRMANNRICKKITSKEKSIFYTRLWTMVFPNGRSIPNNRKFI